MDDTFGALIIIIFVISISFYIFRFIENEQSPILTTKAKLVKKKKKFYNMGVKRMKPTNITYYLIYELDTGSNVKFIVNRRLYKNSHEGEEGLLTFQGTRFIKFENSNGTLER